jgi:hypothetical protein
MAAIHSGLVDLRCCRGPQDCGLGSRLFHLKNKSEIQLNPVKIANGPLALLYLQTSPCPHVCSESAAPFLQSSPCSLYKLPIHPIFLHKNP